MISIGTPTHPEHSDHGWNPRSYAGLRLWLRADKGVTLNGGDVSGWADQSGLGNDYVQVTVAEQPLFTASHRALNGQAALTFDGADHVLDMAAGAPGLGTINNCTMFFVVDSHDNAGTQTLIREGGGNWAGLLVTTLSVNDGTANRTAGAALNGAQVLTCLIDAATPEIQWRRDGVAAGAAVAYDATFSGDRPNIGANGSGSQPFNGEIAEVIIYNRVLSSVEIARVELYLATRYAPSFLPIDLTPALWLRGDLGVTLNGGDVSGWADQSASGLNFIQGTGSKQPLWVAASAGFGGQSVVTFNGTSDFLQEAAAGGIGNSDDCTIFYVYSATNDTSRRIMQGAQIVYATNHLTKVGYFDGTNFGGDTAPLVSTPNYVTLTLDPAVGGQYRRNGADIGAVQLYDGTFDLSAPALAIGSSSDGGSGWINGSIAEIVVYNRVLTDAEIGMVEAYIATRYGL